MGNLLNYEQRLYEVLNKSKESKTIYALMGFDKVDFSKIVVDRLFGNNVSINEEIDKQSITLKTIANIQSGNPFVMYYEELALTAESVLPLLNAFDYKVILINNNLFYKYYPLPNFLVDREIVELIDKQSENNIQKCYDHYVKVNNKHYFSYASINLLQKFKSLEIYNYENECSFNEQEFDEEYLELSFGSIEESYLETLLIVLEYSHINKILVKEDSKGLLFYHKNLLNVLSNIGYKISIKQKTLECEKANYSKYEKILKRKNSNYKFREIDFYKNPGQSLERVKINQGFIIDSIAKNAIQALDKQRFNDVFVTAPTGSGKSVLFQIPAIYLAEKYKVLTIVITPLIGLMSDQVENIKSMTNCAATLNSEYTPSEKEEIKERIRQGEVSILYISPETLLSNGDIKNLIGERNIGLMVIDESHIVSTWGKSFRPDYWFLGDYINSLRSKFGYNFPIATFSATVTYGGDDDMHGDIIDSLRMRPGDFDFIAPMRRDDISFEIKKIEKENDYNKEKRDAVINSLTALLYENNKTIAYFPFTKQVNNYHKELGMRKSARYYGSITKEEKHESLEKFRNSNVSLMLATKAFGMGIDIDDVQTVYHFAPTGNLCDYVQEIGRAARKPEIKGLAKLDYFEDDFRYIKQLHGMSAIKNYQIIETLKKLKDIYYQNDKRNFTVSPALFSYIFPNSKDDDVDAKFKTVLLMIQKDFERDRTLNFKPLIFKPKSMFTKGYVLIKDEDIDKIKNKPCFKYFRIYKTKSDMASKFKSVESKDYVDKYTGEIKTSYSSVITTVRLQGDVYTVDYKRMWEENFESLSFGQFKRAFFNGELKDFKESKCCLPEHLLSINALRKNGKTLLFEEVIEKSTTMLDEITKQLSEYAYEKKHLSINDIARIIKENNILELEDVECRIAAENYIKFLDMFNSNRFNNARVFSYFPITEKYSINSYTALKNKTKALTKHIKDKLNAVKKASNKTILLHDSNSNLVEQKDMVMAQLLEIFRLATYEVVSGEKPEYFIRINSISAIDRILDKENYKSKMVSLVEMRHNDSIRKMKHFFVDLSTDKERWDYIEKYFVGDIEQ